jgi:hypothetical protein
LLFSVPVKEQPSRHHAACRPPLPYRPAATAYKISGLFRYTTGRKEVRFLAYIPNNA